MRPPNVSGALTLLCALGLLLLGSDQTNDELLPAGAERSDRWIVVSTARTPALAPAPRTGSRHLRDVGRGARAELTALGVAAVVPLAMRRAFALEHRREPDRPSFAPVPPPPRAPPSSRALLG